MNYADSNQIANLKGSADIIEEVDDLVTYLGFCQKGTTSENSLTWSIMKIEASGTTNPIVSTFKWAKGLCSYNLQWSERAGYDYSYKKF